jgi:hypothetical protein
MNMLLQRQETMNIWLPWLIQSMRGGLAILPDMRRAVAGCANYSFAGAGLMNAPKD